MVAPKLTDDARATLAASPEEFLKTYGDEFINAVTFGAALYLVIEINTHSESEAQRMRVDASESGGAVAGSIEVNEVLNRISNENRMSIQISSVGVDKPPPVQRPSVESIYQYIDKVFEWLNNFK